MEKRKIVGKEEDRYLAGLPEVCGELESVVQSTMKSRKKLNWGVLTFVAIFSFNGIASTEVNSQLTGLVFG